jgi:hypothetical protein
MARPQPAIPTRQGRARRAGSWRGTRTRPTVGEGIAEQAEAGEGIAEQAEAAVRPALRKRQCDQLCVDECRDEAKLIANVIKRARCDGSGGGMAVAVWMAVAVAWRWPCGRTHGIEEDKRRCLWAGCGRHFAKPFEYRAHKGVHTGAVSDRNGCGLAPGLAPAEFCCRGAFAPLSTGNRQLASTVETGNWLIKIDAME